jgi:agmatine/peptidylarginine deiminase
MKYLRTFSQLMVLLAFLAVYCPLLAEDQEASLPIELTPDELLRLNEIGFSHTKTLPPPQGNIRCPAEWEPSEGVIIRYPLGISYELVAELSEDFTVYTILAEIFQSTAVDEFTSHGVNMANVEFIIASTNSHWTRDYGPWFIFDGNGDYGIVDHIYNRPRPLDDQIPGVIGTEWGVSVYGMDLVHAGGNHMSDGLGRSISTTLVYEENPGLTQTEVDDIMNLYLGNDYVTIEDALAEYIEHIDCWAKFLDPQTIMVLDVPQYHARYDELNAAADYFATLVSAWGRPYDIVRVFSGGSEPYTNSIILNNKVFVPITGSINDDDALATYEDAMPGYEVLGFTGNWYNTDALHCRTMGVPDREMLFIHHVPLFVVGSSEDDYLVTAEIIDHSETGLITEELKIFYRTTEDVDFSVAPLVSTPTPGIFTGFIPYQLQGTEILYHLQASDNSGRTEFHPYIGPAGAHKFKVNSAPLITSEDSLVCKAEALFAYTPEIDDADDTEHDITYTDNPVWTNNQNGTLAGTAPASYSEHNFSVEVSDGYSSCSQDIKLIIYVCGDIDFDSDVDILDIVVLIDNKFKDGPAPDIIEAADVDNSGIFDVLDIVYLIDKKFKEGPDPICPD